MSIQDPNIKIYNGSFEYPVTATWLATTPTYWSSSGNVGVCKSTYVTVTTFPEGAQSAFLQTSCLLTQSVSGFTPGAPVTLSFWLVGRAGAFGPSNTSVLLDDYIITQSLVPPSQATWTQYLLYFTASAISHSLIFSGSTATDKSNGIDKIEFLTDFDTANTYKASKANRAISLGINKRMLNLSSSVVGYGQGISLGGPSTLYGDNTNPVRHMQMAVTRSSAEGSPDAPSLCLSHVGMWRFRWVVKPGQRRVVVRVKQTKILSGNRPTMVIKANPSVGLNADISVAADETSDWTLLGPVIFTSTGTDAVWVELWNNLRLDDSPAYFDHITVT